MLIHGCRYGVHHLCLNASPCNLLLSKNTLGLLPYWNEVLPHIWHLLSCVLLYSNLRKVVSWSPQHFLLGREKSGWWSFDHILCSLGWGKIYTNGSFTSLINEVHIDYSRNHGVHLSLEEPFKKNSTPLWICEVVKRVPWNMDRVQCLILVNQASTRAWIWKLPSLSKLTSRIYKVKAGVQIPEFH